MGIDEVGRGALAGPVVVSAVFLPQRLKLKKNNIPKLRDSKKLTPSAREKWFAYIKTHEQIFFAVARVYPRGIEAKNIARAANLAAFRAFMKLMKEASVKSRNFKIVLDGGLYLSKEPAPSPKLIKTVIKGDEKFNAIKLASIAAKVTRDHYMTKLHQVYPVYGFDIHKGYGTKRHFRAIKRHGISPAHRLTFLKKYINIE